MTFVFDFGFEKPGVSWDDASLGLFFAGFGEETDFGKTPGPLAVADASRYVELFEMQVGLAPLEIGTYAEIVGTADPIDAAARRAAEANKNGIFPIIVGEDRRITEQFSGLPLVAFWGKVGRSEANELEVFRGQPTMLAGVRAATSKAFKAIPGNVAIATSRALGANREMFRAMLSQLKKPVYLSIDLDVLAPSVAQTARSIEPGGLSWYELMDAIEMVFDGPGVAAADLVGLGKVAPRSPAAFLGAQILIRIAGLLAIKLSK